VRLNLQTGIEVVFKTGRRIAAAGCEYLNVLRRRWTGAQGSRENTSG